MGFDALADDWVKVRANIRLQAGDLFEHEGRSYWIKDIKQDFNPGGHFTFNPGGHFTFNPGGHFTYVRLKPMLVPRSRYERLSSDDDPW